MSKPLLFSSNRIFSSSRGLISTVVSENMEAMTDVKEKKKWDIIKKMKTNTQARKVDNESIVIGRTN